MRTKHLFYTAAMAALFAACVNDDFETIGQQENVINDGRPVVSDVKLKFTQGGADTRLVYEGQGRGYAWQANDTIGALLMDNVVAEKPEDENLTWLQKYQLVDDIHTSYPFTYSTAGETWGCNTKMLEGNYFFAYPWEDYKGERRVKHSLTNQTQQGVGAEVRAESYAENQFFIGYSQIMAGTSDKDVLSEVTMVPVLGAIQLQIVNTGTQTYHINKVVLKSGQLHSTLTFDPTDAPYGTWNLEKDNNIDWVNADDKFFNYANYTGNEEDIYASGQDFVYNITGDETEKYEANDALRAVVREDPTTATDDFAQIIIKGTNAERALVSTKTDEDAVAYVLIMANAVSKDDLEELTMDIYTDEGIVRNIDLMSKNTGTNGKPDDYQAITTSEVKAIGPSIINTIGVQIDDNSFLTPDAMDIYTNEDLLQFIQWNVNETGAQEITANLVKPGVTLTKEMADLLAENEDIEITFTSVNEEGASLGYLLTLAEDVPADFLDLENVTINCGINVEGSLVLTDDSKLTNITVAEDATLNINKKLAPKSEITITNNGVLNVAEDVNVSANVAIENNGKLNIAADADVRGTITNNLEAEVNNEGYILDIVNKGGTEKNGVVNLGKEATIAGGTNEGIIRTDNGSKVSVEGSGEIIFVVGADVTTKKNTVSYEAADDEDIDDKTYAELYEAGVSKLILKGDVELTAKGIAPATAASFAKVVAEDGSSLTVGDEVSLTISDELLIEGNAMTNGAINATNKVTVEKDVVLTNNGAITTNNFENNGTVNNRGSVNAKSVTGSKGKTGFRYNDPYVNDGKFEMALQDAVELFMNKTNAYKNTYTVTLGDAKTENTFLYFMNSTAFKDQEAVKALKDCGEFKSLTQAQLNAAVAAIEKDNKETLVEALKIATLKTQGTAYETKTGKDATKAAYAAFKQGVLKKSSEIGELDGISYSVARAANQLSETDIDGILAEAKPQMYIWQQTTCPLYDVMVVALAHDKKTWAEAMPDKLEIWNKETGNIASWSGLQTWMNAVATTNSTAVIMTDATTVMKKYASSYSSWTYEDGQFKALSGILNPTE